MRNCIPALLSATLSAGLASPAAAQFFDGNSWFSYNGSGYAAAPAYAYAAPMPVVTTPLAYAAPIYGYAYRPVVQPAYYAAPAFHYAAYRPVIRPAYYAPPACGYAYRPVVQRPYYAPPVYYAPPRPRGYFPYAPPRPMVVADRCGPNGYWSARLNRCLFRAK
jgi:hypothetical protein